MNTVLNWLMSPEWGQIVEALLHSLWQAGSLALLLGLALKRLTSPAWRYRFAIGSLGGVLLATILTWGVLNQRETNQLGSPGMPAEGLSASFEPEHRSGAGEKLIFTAAPFPRRGMTTGSMNWTTWLAPLWLLGAVLMLVRAGIQVAGAERLRRSGRPLEDARIAQLLAETQRAIGLARTIRIAVTNTLTSPAVVGVIIPTLILPLSLVTALTHEQLRFVLLHELAHIRRGDYFVNLFQLFVEALLFFNPAVWWISHQVRREREACCDALAIELSGAPADYARTLVQVAENVLNPSPAAAAAFGNKRREPSSLSDRVQRLLVPGYRPALRLTWHAILMSLVAGGTLLVLSALGTRNTVGAILAGETRNESQGSDLQTNSNSTPPISTAAPSVKEANTLIVGGTQASIAGKRTADDLANNGRATIIKKLDQIHLDRVHFESTPLSDVLRVLAQAAKEQDPQGRGINFIYNSGDQPREVMEQPPLDQHRILNDELAKREKERSNLRDRFTDEHPRVLQLNLEISRLTRVKASLEPVLITIAPLPTILPLADLLNIIVTNASQPIHCSIQDFGVLFTRGIPPENLLTRRIKVHPATLYRWSDPPNYVDAPPRTNRVVAPLVDSSLDHTKHPLHRLFTEAGIDMQPPKTFFYKDRIGELFVRATPAEIERLTKLLAETDRETARGFSDDLFAANAKTTKDASQTSNAVNESSSPLKSSELRELTDKVPVLGDLPLIGKLFRSGSNGQSSAVEESSELHSRRFKVDLDRLYQALEITSSNSSNHNVEGLPSIPRNYAKSGIVYLTRTNTTQSANQAIRSFFTDAGVDLQPPKTVFLNDRNGELFVRATQADLDRLTPLLAEFVETAPADYNGTNAALLVQSARRLMEAGQRETAKAKLQSALEMEPTNHAAKHYLGLITKSDEQGQQSQPAGATNTAQAKPLQDDRKEAVSPFNVQAGNMNLDSTTRILIASNGVVIKDGGTVITADSARINQEAGEAVAEGNVKVQSESGTLAGDRVTFNSNTGKMQAERFSPSRSSVPSDKTGTPQILIEARFIELFDFDPQSEPPDSPLRNLSTAISTSSTTNPATSTATAEFRAKFGLTNNLILETVSPATVTQLLTKDQAEALVTRLIQQPGVDILSAPKVSTGDGRPAQIQVTDMRTIVTAVETNLTVNADGKQQGGINYLTEAIPFGSVLDVVPSLDATDDGKINLTILAHNTEFIGYDDPGDFVPSVVSAPGALPLKGVLPLPRARLRELNAPASMPDGQSILLSGPVSLGVTRVKNKVPVLGDIPLLGKLFRSTKTSTVKKHLLVLVKASLVDEHGAPFRKANPATQNPKPFLWDAPAR